MTLQIPVQGVADYAPLRGTSHQGVLADWLAETPFTLAMSSGFFGFFAHFGTLRALLEHGLAPARFCGSSAGALVGACVASGASINAIEDMLLGLDRSQFWDPSPGLGLLSGQAFRRMLAGLLPAQRMEEARTPLAVSAWQAKSRRTQVLQQGNLVEAVYASCAVPLLFQPARIGGRYYWDGGIADRHGLAATYPGERVLYHHLQSRSPWRGSHSKALHHPSRPNLVTLAIDGLVRSGPGKLEQGRQAMHQAYNATGRALARPVGDALIIESVQDASS
ncbi:patatin-like phospholipase family protein [Alcanivorax sp.]|uniref:patatin-like phospholipase family protein n=1 Tax=Alcanivorax sp. TaxID=1872427 RepID=UPI0025B85BDF|nr:patatin-like phospholipase family protein [Alcanivorax sp.]